MWDVGCGYCFTFPSAGDMRNQLTWWVGDGELRMNCQMLNLDQGKRLLPSMKPCSFCAHKVLPQYGGRSDVGSSVPRYCNVHVQYSTENRVCRLSPCTFRLFRGQGYKIVPEVIGARTAMRMSIVRTRHELEYHEYIHRICTSTPVLYSVLILPGARYSGLISSLSA